VTEPTTKEAAAPEVEVIEPEFVYEETMFSKRDLPWMQLGTPVDEAQSLEDAIKLAGLDWEVELRKDGYQNAKGNWVTDPSKRKVVRVDTDKPLGTVSSTYEALQYRDAFDFLADTDAMFVAGGQLKFGKQAFMVVQLPGLEHLEVAGGDQHDMYTVIRTSHDGSRALEILQMALRGTCMNALTLSSFGKSGYYGGKAKQRWSIRHTQNMRTKMEQVSALLSGTQAYRDEFAETAARLAAIDLELKDAEKIITKLVEVQHGYVKDQETYVTGIMNTYQHSTRNGYLGNGWGLVNAVSEHYEHVRGGDRRTAEARWTQAFDGLTHKAVDRTAQLLLAA
jgi:phage/plasmid-like protein (TIGR03299 family)